MDYVNHDLGFGMIMIAEARKQRNHIVLGNIAEYPGFGMVSDLFVDQPDRNTGKGMKLVMEIIQLAQDSGRKGLITEVRVDNAPALKLFEKNGFQKIEEFKDNGVEYYRLSLKFND